MISAVTIAPVPHAHIDLRKTRNHPCIDRARVVPRIDTDTIHDGEGAIRATRTRARLDDIFLRLIQINLYQAMLYIRTQNEYT